MKALHFIIGMFVGMILLVVAIVGAIFAAGSLVSVGQLENTLGTDVFDDASEINDKTLLQVAQDLIADLQDKDNLTINLLRNKYGLRIPEEISGIDISVLFDYPITQIADNLGDVVNNMTLRDVGEFLKMDFENDYDIPVLKDNLDNKINVALDNVLKSIDGDTLTLAAIEANFGITLGENDVFDKLYYTPLSQFGEVMNALTVNTLMSLDSNIFLPADGAPVYVVTDAYVEISADELANPDRVAAEGVETYIAGVDESDNLLYKELCYVANGDSYKVDNSCYAADFDAATNETVYYRHVLYVEYDATASYPADITLVTPAYLNCFVSDGAGSYEPARDGWFDLGGLFLDDTLSVSVEAAVLNGSLSVGANGIAIPATAVFVAGEEGAQVAKPVVSYGLPDGEVTSATRLEEGKSGFLLVHEGTADMAIQALAAETINSLANATDKITSLKLGEVIDIDDDSAMVLKALADTPINKMSERLDTLTLSEATEITMSEYTEDADGMYVFVETATGGYYTLYNPNNPDMVDATRYKKSSVAGESSPVLQRLASVAIPDISESFSSLLLGEALGVDVDTFASVGTADYNPNTTYYEFDADLGYPKRATYIVDADSYNENKDHLFVRTYEGESSSVLKQLAFVRIDDASAAMDQIVEDTLLSDIIDVVAYTVVEDYTEGDEYWLIEKDAYFTQKDANGNEVYYTYVYDGDGKYYKTSELYLPATAEQLSELAGETVYYTYTPNSGKDKGYFANTAVYYPNGTTYERNDALTAYYFAKGNLDKLQASYSRDGASADTAGAIAAETYLPAATLYVCVFGNFEKYDPDNLSHLDEQLYWKYTEGYYLYSGDNDLAGETLYVYDYPDDVVTYSEVSSAEAANGKTLYVKIPADDDNKYYFAELVSANEDETANATTYSKRECSVIFKKDDAGAYVYFNGEYTEYDAANADHNDLQRYARYIAYLGNRAAVSGSDSGTGNLPPLVGDGTTIDELRVSVVEEASPTLLLSLLNRNVTVGSLNDTVNTLTLEELMDIEPDSIFDDESIRKATIDTLSSVIVAKFTKMTVGELLTYAKITTVNAQVKAALENVTLADFFGALTFDATSGQIVVDMEKLFGVD